MSARPSRHPKPAGAPQRGVYVSDLTGPNGERSITLVNRRGEAVLHAQVARAEDVAVVRRELRRTLQAIDPHPLRLL